VDFADFRRGDFCFTQWVAVNKTGAKLANVHQPAKFSRFTVTVLAKTTAQTSLHTRDLNGC
jgi:hypothetical protein